ncbi:MAG: amino acid--tRNA ligase-related protein [Candidatus Bathyarchaeia archaeon]|jgi:asparaginyl-tRNA synthetase
MRKSHVLDEENKTVLKVRAKILKAARCWLDEKGFLEVQGPILIPAVGGLPGYFEVNYFGKKAYLAQGLQPYADTFVANFGKVYTIAPAFRVERERTKRHLSEYWRVELSQECDFDTIVSALEELLVHVCHSLSRDAKEELEFLHRSVEELSNVRAPFRKLTYDEVVDVLQKDGFRFTWGEKIDRAAEKHVSVKFNQPFFITQFPVGIQTLFYKPHPQNVGSTLTADLLAPEGYGEIGSGGQMENERKALLMNMTQENFALEEEKWYMNLRGTSFPVSEFVLGVERLIQWICKLDDIKSALAFPRLPDNFYP